MSRFPELEKNIVEEANRSRQDVSMEEERVRPELDITDCLDAFSSIEVWWWMLSCSYSLPPDAGPQQPLVLPNLPEEPDCHQDPLSVALSGLSHHPP